MQEGCVGTPIGKGVLQVLADDPRSPTMEFERTPIVVEALPKKLHNKNLDNVRKQLVALTPAGKILKNIETSPKIDSNKRKSMVGVLETNLDFKETDLDEVIQKKLECNSLEEFNKSIGVYEEIDADPRSPTSDFVRTPLQILKKVGEITLNDTNNTKENLSSEDDEEENDEKLLQIVPKDELTVVRNFDKKLTNLIYEDKTDDLIQKPAKTKENNLCRTPLGVRNCIEQNNGNGNNKIVSKLRVSDKPLKTHVTSSRIPVFKEKRGKGVLQQCENTPPRSMPESTIANKSKKKSQWDADRTLVI